MAHEAPDQAQSATRQQGNVLKRIMSQQMGTYYSNCVMLATSPREISILFGRFIPVGGEAGSQGLAEFYERQIYMTLEQAEDLARILTQTVEAFKSRKVSA
jgi:hypothetical protein